MMKSRLTTAFALIVALALVGGFAAQAQAHCQVPCGIYDDEARFTAMLEDAATVMAEAMKTLMEKPNFGGVNKLVHYSMYQGVRSSTAQDYWDNGTCEAPGAELERIPQASRTRALTADKSGTGTPYPSFTIKIP